jgi:acetyl esterase/lipase
MISVHGGRWCAETRLTNAVIDSRLADSGVFVMALDFRMPPLAKFPVPVADINLAIRWLKQRAPSLGLDANAIGGIGTSSGGHQLLLNALRPDDARFAAESLPDGLCVDASLAFIIACWPVADPLARYHYALEEKMSIHVDSHRAYWKDEAEMAEGSPQRIVEAGEMTHLPPLLLIQGTDDTVLSPGMTRRFAAAYRAAGGAVSLREFSGQPHTFITKAPGQTASQAALDAITAFALSRGRLAEPCAP